MNVAGTINTEGEYIFPNFLDLTFTNPVIEVMDEVDAVKPGDMTINVNIRIQAEGSANGYYFPDINPVPVNNLDYNGTELIQRITERLVDFRV